MSKKDKSVFLDKERVIAVSKNANSVAEVIETFGLALTGGNYRTYYKYCNMYGIEPPKNQSRGIKKAQSFIRQPYSEILVENSTYKWTKNLKDRLIRDGLLENVCYVCGQVPIWNGKPLTLQLDHINGVNNDNRIENLRILCPNCHTQTKTYGNKRRTPKEKKTRTINYKIEWPDLSTLLSYLKEQSIVALGERLGVSDNAIRKHLKRNGVDTASLAWHNKDRLQYISDLLTRL